MCRRRWARALGVVNGHTGVEIARLQHSASEICEVAQENEMSHHVGRRSTRGVMLLWNGTYASLVPTQLASRLAARRRIVLVQLVSGIKKPSH